MGQWRRRLPFKPAPTAEASAVHGGLTQFVPKQEANATYNSLRAQFLCDALWRAEHLERDRGYFAQALERLYS